MLGIDFWTSAGLLAFALAVTLLADWLVARSRNERLRPGEGLWRQVDDWLGRLVWVALMYVGVALGVRYLERVGHALFGYALLFLLVLLLSLGRAALYRRSAQRSPQATAAWQVPGWGELLRGAMYLLAAAVLLLVLLWLTGQRLRWLSLVLALLGALLTELDSQNSLLGRALPFVSRPLEVTLGKGQTWRTPAVAAGLALVALPLLAVGGWQSWIALPLGFTSHLLLDLLGPRGAMLLWPLSRTRHHILGGKLLLPGSRAERWLAALLGLAATLLAVAVGVGAEPPPPIAVPSYEQTLERYYAQRGRTLVYASVQGTWQASGRRIGGTFEVLNAAGSSLILLDRFTGQVFTAGRSADDDLYVNGISLQIGDTVRIKPAEIHLKGEALASVLPVIYQMQAEPGVQHIFISGDLLVPLGLPGPPVDYGQTSLQRVRELEPGHYRLRYLTAAELIGLADLEVETAQLLVVGIYAVPASGPTVTPLPSPPKGAGASP
jgi:hypothetical protein